MVCVGLFVGMAVGAALFVPADSGLAGPAITLVYGLVGGAAALAGGTLVARRLDASSLRRSLVVAGVLVAAITVWIGCRLSITFAQGAILASTRGSAVDAGVSNETAVEVRCK